MPATEDSLIATAHSAGPNRRVDQVVGVRLREHREALGLSLAEAGSPVGISEEDLCSYERGERRIPATRLYDLAQLLSTEISTLFA